MIIVSLYGVVWGYGILILLIPWILLSVRLSFIWEKMIIGERSLRGIKAFTMVWVVIRFQPISVNARSYLFVICTFT